MSDDLQESSQEKQQQQPIFDGDAAQRLFGLSDRQRRFADNVLKGANQGEAAREAGYPGEGATLRATGSRVGKSSAVRNYIALARSENVGPSESPVDSTELKRVLSRHIRGADKNASIRACEILNRIEAKEAEERAAANSIPDPNAILEQIAQLGEVWTMLAAALAKGFGITWAPKVQIPVDFAEKLLDAFDVSPGDVARQRFIADLTGYSIPEPHPLAAAPGNASDRALTGRSIARTNPNGKYHT